MTVPSVEMLLVAGRALFLIFSFVLATVAFIRWRRAIEGQTVLVLANHDIVLQRLADLEARIVATNVSISQLGERIQRPQQLASAPTAPAPGYQIAIRLAKAGASREEWRVERFGPVEEIGRLRDAELIGAVGRIALVRPFLQVCYVKRITAIMRKATAQFSAVKLTTVNG